MKSLDIFKLMIQNFLGNKKVNNYRQLVEELRQNYRKLCANMSMKMHFPHSHLGNIFENCGYLSDEQSETFHQHIQVMEEICQGCWKKRMMADYCWSLKRDKLYQHHLKKSRKIMCLELFTSVLESNIFDPFHIYCFVQFQIKDPVFPKPHTF